MSIVFGLLIDLYLAVVVLDWLLTSTRLRVSPVVAAKLQRIAEPFLTWIRSVLQPSFNGVDLSRLVAVVLLVLVRSVLTAILS